MPGISTRYSAFLFTRGHFFVRRGVPELDVPVQAARCERAPVGRECDGGDRAEVAFELHELLERDRAPKPHAHVRAPGGDGSAVGRERD